MSGDLINAALRKNKGLFYQYSTQNFLYAVQAQRFTNNFNVTSPTSWRIRSKCIQKFKQNAMKNMHYLQFLILYYVYTEYCNGNL